MLRAAEVPAGSLVRIMRSSAAATVGAAGRATAAALQALGGRRPRAALSFDCVATRLRMGEAFDAELGAVSAALPDVELVGCSTHGQIAQAPGQFDGFHNCSAVVCLLPE